MQIRTKAALAGLAATAATVVFAVPAQALTGVVGGPVTPAITDAIDACDSADWDWSIANPARYQAGPHEAVVGLSDAKRTVTIKVPTSGTCKVEAGDKWSVYNGYFTAEGTFSDADVAAGQDSDVVYVEKPSSNSVAGDDITVHLKVSDPDQPGWEVSKSSSVAPLNILRRTVFNYKGTDNRINFSEPYQAEVPITSGGKLLRASWSSNAYYGYAGRNVHIQWRADEATSKYADVQEVTTGDDGSVNCSFRVDAAGGPVPGQTFLLRALYYGNGTSSGNWSTGDRVAPA